MVLWKFRRFSFFLLFDSDYKDNMMNFLLVHCDGLKWLMVAENCMIFEICAPDLIKLKIFTRNCAAQTWQFLSISFKYILPGILLSFNLFSWHLRNWNWRSARVKPMTLKSVQSNSARTVYWRIICSRVTSHPTLKIEIH